MLKVKFKPTLYPILFGIVFSASLFASILYHSIFDSSSLPEINGVISYTGEPFEKVRFTTLDGSTYQPQAFNGHWSIMFVGSEQCKTFCLMTLDTFKQLSQQLWNDDKLLIEQYVVSGDKQALGVISEQNKDKIFLNWISKKDSGSNEWPISIVSQSHLKDKVFLVNPSAKVVAEFSPSKMPNGMQYFDLDKLASDIRSIIQYFEKVNN